MFSLPKHECTRIGTNAPLEKFAKTSQGRFAEPPLGDEVNRHIHSCSLLATRYWLEGETCKAFIDTVYGGEGASRPLLSEFIDGVRDGCACAARATGIHHKQITCAVKGQTLCAVRHGTKGRTGIP